MILDPRDIPEHDPLRLMAELYLCNGLGQKEIAGLLGYAGPAIVCTSLSRWAKTVPTWPRDRWGMLLPAVQSVRGKQRIEPTESQLARAAACKISSDDHAGRRSRWRKIHAARVYARGGITLRRLGQDAGGLSPERVRQIVLRGRRLDDHERHIMRELHAPLFDADLSVADGVRLKATLERIVAMAAA